MKKILNIVSSTPIKDDFVGVDFVEFYNFDEKIKNNDLPTVYVGWKRTKNLFPHINILHSKFDIKKYWIFDKTERLNEYYTSINNIFDNLAEIYLEGINYNIIDPYFKNINNEDELINILPNKILKSYYYQKKKTVYLFLENKKDILAVNLEAFEFRDFNIVKILNVIHERTIHFYVETEKDSIINEYTSIFQDFHLLRRYLVSII